MRLSHIAVLALPAAFFLCAPLPIAADDGFIMVKGTEGASVHVDGNPAGIIPLGEIRLGEGEHTIKALKRGYLSAGKKVYLQSLRGETIVLYLKPKTAKGAALRNLTFPGWGSWYSERRKEALGYLAVQSILVGYAFYENSRFESHHDDYDAALTEYESGVGADEIASARSARDNAYDKLSSAESKRNNAIWAAVIVQVLSAADGWFRFPFTDAGEDRIALVPQCPAVTGGQTSLALRLRF